MALFGQQSSTPKTKKRKRDVSELTCFGCGKKGHIRRNCPTHKDKQKEDAPKVIPPVVPPSPTQHRLRSLLRMRLSPHLSMCRSLPMPPPTCSPTPSMSIQKRLPIWSPRCTAYGTTSSSLAHSRLRRRTASQAHRFPDPLGSLGS